MKMIPKPAICALLSLSMLAACYEPKEGCLDIAAVNFDAGADDNCCCEYPVLKVEMQQRFNAEVWRPDSAYQLANGQWFRIKSSVFYLSDFVFTQNGVEYGVTDTVQLFLQDGLDTIKEALTEDVFLVRRNVGGYSSGEFRSSGTFDKARFRLGLNQQARRSIPALAPTGHPLRPQNEDLWLGADTGFVFMQIVCARDTLSSSPALVLNLTAADANNILVEQSGNFVHDTGYNFPLILTIDYHSLFAGVDLSNDDEMTMKSKIVANLSAAFHISQ